MDYDNQNDFAASYDQADVQEQPVEQEPEPEHQQAPIFDDVDPSIDGVPRVYVPKAVEYQHSYANAHQSQRNAGRPAPVARRSAQALPKKVPAAEVKTSQQPVPEPKKLASGKAQVKAVLSGDTLVLRLPAPANTIAAEKIVSLSGIVAPRVSRSKKNADEAFGWQSREHLRKKAIGQIVFFQVTFVAKGGKEVGVVKLGDDQGENLATYMVASGFADAAPGAARKDGSLHPDRQALVDLKEKATTEGLGMWSKEENNVSNIRSVEWSLESKGRVFFDKHKGKPLSAIIEQVRDGSTYRVEFLPNNKGEKHNVLLLYLAGVHAPRIPLPPRQDEKEEKQKPAEAPEPFALEAREFVEQRLLHRDIQVVLQGIDKSNNYFGSIVHPKGNISLELLRNGLAKFVPWSAAFCGDNNAKAMREAEQQAQTVRANMWRNADIPEAATTTTTTNNNNNSSNNNNNAADGSGSVDQPSFEGKVIQVVSGDTVVVQDRFGKTKRFQLASITTPRIGNPRANQPAEPWAAEAKEFVRKRLIGKRVRVNVEYTRVAPKNVADQTPRIFATITQNKINIADQLLGAGLAKVVQHRVDEPRASQYDMFLNTEARAIQSKQGLHGGQTPKTRPILDLTEKTRPSAAQVDEEEKKKQENNQRQLSAKAKQYLPFLEKDKNMKGVVEYVFSGTRSKILVPSQNIYISLVIAGVKCPSLPKNKQEQPEPYAEESAAFARAALTQQDVRLEVSTLDKGDNFIGNLFVNNKSFALTLVEEGYARVFGVGIGADLRKELEAAESKAKDQKLRIWKNWVPPKEEVVVATEEKNEEETPATEQQLIPVTVTEIIDPAKFFVQVAGDNTVDFIKGEMAKFGETQGDNPLPAPADFVVKRGLVCAGLFEDSLWYRVRVDKRVSDTEFEVAFMDYGNTEVLDVNALRPIPNRAVSSLPPCARLCTLAAIKGPHSESEYFETARQEFYQMVWEQQILGKVMMRDRASGALHVLLHNADSPLSVNAILLEQGLARIKTRVPGPLRDLAAQMKPHEQKAQSQRAGIWEFGIVSDPEEEGGDKF